MADEQVKIGIVAEDKTGPGVSSAKRNLQGLNQTTQAINRTLALFQGSNRAAWDGVSKDIAGANKALGIFKSTFAQTFGGTFAAFTVAGAVSGLKNMAGAALQSYASYERLSQSINAMAAKEALLTGSATNMAQALAMTKTQSKETLQWISKLAIESPFKQGDVAQAFRLAQALGFNTQEAKRLTAATLDWATATGVEGYAIERANRALGQMRVKGKVSQEEINQLTEAGVDAGRILSDAFGMSGKDLEKAFQSGRITADQAIEAIIADMERLYKGAGKESANSMTGLLSTLEEIQDITGRNLLGGMFQSAQPYLAELTGILNSPEVQGGITAFGAGLGAGLTGILSEAATNAEKVTNAIQPLLDAKAPEWLVSLQAFYTLVNGKPLAITISPTITKITTPDGGLSVEVSAHAAKITVDDTTVKLTADWKEGTIGSLIAAGLDPVRAEQVLLKADWEPGLAAKLAAGFRNTETLNAAQNLGLELSEATKAAFGSVDWSSEWGKVATSFQAYFAPGTLAVEAMAGWQPGTLDKMWNDVVSFFQGKTVSIQANITGAVGNAGNAIGNWWDSIWGGPQVFNGGSNTSRNAPSGGTSTTVNAKRQRAIGEGFHRGGMAWVGEQGPEAVWLPRGTEIMTNRDSRAAFGLPHYAEGTDGAKQFGSAVWGFLRIFGIQRQGEMTGPPTREQWNKTFHDIAGAGIDAAKRTGDAFVNAAGDTAKAFASTLESALGNVPGLFGTSDVTDRQMKLAAAGVPQNFADDYIRQLSDEVLNGKDWAGVDIGDAARRAGIDPNLPNEIVLELVKEAWNNGSFFANAANLDLINTDAVKASLEQQQKQAQGKANIMAMFGLTDESSQATADQLGAALNTVFGQAAESDAMAGSGTVIFNKLITGLSDPSTAAAGISSMAASLTAATGTPENSQAIYDGGVATGITWLKGFDYAMQNASMSPPSVAGPAVGPPTNPNPPGRAVGVGFWAGGYMQVHANETIYAPRGTRVDRPGEGMGMAAATIVNYVTINQQIDEEAFLAKMARRLRAGR